MSNTKDNIKNTALQLFLTKGYSVGINEIIQKSGTSKGAFYHHFNSKEQLFIETVDNFFFGYLTDARLLEVVSYSLREKINHLIEITFEPFKAIGKIVKGEGQLNILNVFAEYPKHKSLREKNTAHFNLFIEILTQILEQGVENGEIKKQVNIQTLCYHIGLLIDGSLVDTMLMYGNIDLAEEVCSSAVNQMMDLVTE